MAVQLEVFWVVALDKGLALISGANSNRTLKRTRRESVPSVGCSRMGIVSRCASLNPRLDRLEVLGEVPQLVYVVDLYFLLICNVSNLHAISERGAKLVTVELRDATLRSFNRMPQF